MSHFTLLAIGEDYAEQLEPFNENRPVAPYLDNEDASDDLASALDFLTTPPTEEEKARAGYTDNPETKHLRDKYTDRELASLTDEERLEIMAWYSDGSDYRIENGMLVHYSTYNPQSKWDWYQVGGRWRGFFKLKPGAPGVLSEADRWTDEAERDKTGWADQARKRDIDFDGMRQAAEDKARAEYAEFAKAVQGLTPPTEGWESLRDRMLAEGKTIDDVRAVYNNQPWVQVSRRVGFIMADPWEYYCAGAADPAEEFARRAKATAIQTYAMLHEGQWIAKGEMGWFGISNDAESSEVFGQKQWELIESLPDDALLTLLDLHI